jgi:hypothetical protein
VVKSAWFTQSPSPWPAGTEELVRGGTGELVTGGTDVVDGGNTGADDVGGVLAGGVPAPVPAVVEVQPTRTRPSTAVPMINPIRFMASGWSYETPR